MKRFKSIVGVILSISIIMGLFICSTISSNAYSEYSISNDNAWFKVYVDENSAYHFTVKLPSTGHLDLSLFMATYDSRVYYKLYDEDYSKSYLNSSTRIENNAPKSGTWGFALSKGTYHFVVETGSKSGYIKIKSHFKSYKTTEKTESTYDNPNTLTLGKKSVGAFTDDYNEDDWYKFTLSKKQIVDLNFKYYSENGYSRLHFYVYNSSLQKEYYNSGEMRGSSASPSSSSTKLTLNKGTYYIKASGYSPRGKYVISYNSYVKPKLSTTYCKIKKGKTKTLKVTGGSGTIKWTTSNKKIATVTSKGKVKGKKKGYATITAKRNGYRLSCKVKVV